MTEQQQESDPAYPDKLKQTERDLLRRRSGRGPDINHMVGSVSPAAGFAARRFVSVYFRGSPSRNCCPRSIISLRFPAVATSARFTAGCSRAKRLRAYPTSRISLPRAPRARPKEWPPRGNFRKGKVFRWLRENGRYLAPSGSGDVLLAGAAMLRNFLAVQLVLATFVLMIFIAAQLIREGSRSHVRVGKDEACAWWGSLQTFWRINLPGGKGAIWWSPYAALVPILFLFFAVPPGWCYWLVEKPNRSTAGCWIPPFYGWLAAVLLSLPGSVIGVCASYRSDCAACAASAAWQAKSQVLTQTFPRR